jgi:hypothetical protein
MNLNNRFAVAMTLAIASSLASTISQVKAAQIQENKANAIIVQGNQSGRTDDIGIKFTVSNLSDKVIKIDKIAADNDTPKPSKPISDGKGSFSTVMCWW